MVQIYILSLCLVFIGGKEQLLFAQFDTADQVKIEITPFITFSPSSNTFLFQYTVTSSSSSRQVLRSIDFTTADKPVQGGGTITNVFRPSNAATWRGIATFSSDIGSNIIGWYPTDKTRSVDDLYQPPSQALQPTQSLVGLGEASQFLPAPSTFYAQGWVRPANEEELVNFINQKLRTTFDVTSTIPPKVLKQVYPEARAIRDNSFQSITLTPMQSPVGLSALNLVDRFISLKHQSVSLGWIFGPGVDGIVNSLDSKLSAAKNSISRGDNKTAANQLNAFINELDVQRGKHLNDNAYFLLKANAQFIISKLGVPK